MKNLLLLLAIFGSLNGLIAQCGAPQSSIDLHGNNIQARIQNGGDLFTDFVSAQFVPNPNPDIGIPSPGTIFGAGLWMGGLDPAGNIKLAAVNYRGSSGTDYSAGPLDDDGFTDVNTCANWDRHFRVTGAEIAAFLDALPMTQAQALAQFPAVMGWPGRGNPYFMGVWGYSLPATPFHPLAPFMDVDQDSKYDPLKGDYPVVGLRSLPMFVPAEIIWSVFNDQKGGASHPVTNGKSIQMEVQQTAWAFNCPNEPVLNNTVFTSHKLIHYGSETIDSFYVGLWVDFDLGCYADDCVGCSPSRNTFFAYNQDAVDGTVGSTCNGVATFGSNVPVQAVTFLESNNFSPNKLDKFMAYGVDGSPATGDPVHVVEYYRNLTGSWRDGSPITAGGSGYGGTTPTDYLFPGDPSDINGWSMCTSNLPSNDQRVIGTQKVGKLIPGQIQELNTAWSVHFENALPCSLGNTLSEVDMIRSLHQNGYTDVCSPLTKVPYYPNDSIVLFPNPTTGDATLRYGGINVSEIRIFDATGKLVQQLKNLEKGQTLLRLGQLPVGMYSLRLLTEEGYVTKKLVVAR